MLRLAVAVKQAADTAEALDYAKRNVERLGDKLDQCAETIDALREQLRSEWERLDAGGEP